MFSVMRTKGRAGGRQFEYDENVHKAERSDSTSNLDIFLGYAWPIVEMDRKRTIRKERGMGTDLYLNRRRVDGVTFLY